MEWCDRCATYRTVLDPVTGWCVVCTERVKNEAQRIADDEEERRLIEAEEARQIEEVMRERNAIKKARERMREEYNANPRKGRTQD